ncbi:MAG: threonine--tRNA ligase [Calditrichaeota bacterium]|nr:threonine--tRNA ligase [Calditrichota bacterium]
MSDLFADISQKALSDACQSLRQCLGGSLPDGVIGAECDGRLYGLDDPVDQPGRYRLLTVESPRGLELLWHSAAHLLAQAVRRLYPKAKLGIGPAIKDGFYYDFDFGEPISSDDLPRLEGEMQRQMEADYPIVRSEVTADQALQFFGENGQDYKIELIKGLEGRISTYTQAEFTDLCRGPHVPSTGWIRHFKLLSLTGAYWRGDERNPMLQRIYGTAYPTAEQLEAHLHRIEEAKRRDHRVLGRQLGLFSFHNEAPGAPFWHPRGVVLFDTVRTYVRQTLRRRGYQEVQTPLILARDLWERSGHWDHYQRAMYFTSQEDRDYAVKPMNCPGHVLMFGERQWSYRDLPVRFAEMGIVHRYEKSGTLHGLMRVRHITQDDAHVFCTEDQIVDEVVGMIDLIFEIYGRFGMTDFVIDLSTRPLDRIGGDALWDRAESALKEALSRVGRPYQVNEGEGAFYGPKIDFHVSDSLGRTWQCSTIQVDFNFPERFNLEYAGTDNQPHRPVMLHRAILGSLERFLGVLIEHYGGDFPLWLAPVQAAVLPITDAQHGFAGEVERTLKDAGLRVQSDLRSEKIGKKIRDAELEKIPYMLIIGAREAAAGSVALRHRGEGDLGAVDLNILVQRLKTESEQVSE